MPVAPRARHAISQVTHSHHPQVAGPQRLLRSASEGSVVDLKLVADNLFQQRLFLLHSKNQWLVDILVVLPTFWCR